MTLDGDLLKFCLLFILMILSSLVCFNKCFNLVFSYITIYPNQDIQDYLEIYLQADMNCANLPKDGKKPAHFNLALVNQVNDKMSITKGIFHPLVFLNFLFFLFFCLGRLCNSFKNQFYF